LVDVVLEAQFLFDLVFHRFTAFVTCVHHSQTGIQSVLSQPEFRFRQIWRENGHFPINAAGLLDHILTRKLA
jgi:hypothetical protein